MKETTWQNDCLTENFYTDITTLPTRRLNNPTCSDTRTWAPAHVNLHLTINKASNHADDSNDFREGLCSFSKITTTSLMTIQSSAECSKSHTSKILHYNVDRNAYFYSDCVNFSQKRLTKTSPEGINDRGERLLKEEEERLSLN